MAHTVVDGDARGKSNSLLDLLLLLEHLASLLEKLSIAKLADADHGGAIDALCAHFFEHAYRENGRPSEDYHQENARKKEHQAEKSGSREGM